MLASTRERQSSFARMLRTCMSTVRGLRNSSRGDLAVGAADGDQPHDLELAARERAALAVDRPRAPEPLLDGLAELRDLGGGPRRRAAGRRACGRCGRPRTRRSIASSRSPAAASATPARCRICARSTGIRSVACSSSGARELLGGELRLALQERDLGERVRERGQRVGVPRLGRDPRQRLGAGVGLLAGRRRGRTGRRRPAAPRSRSGGPRCAPSARAGSGSARAPASRSLS